MKQPIQTLGQLDQVVKNIWMSGSFKSARNDMERLAWHLVTGTPFNTDILLKGAENGPADTDGGEGQDATENAPESLSDTGKGEGQDATGNASESLSDSGKGEGQDATENAPESLSDSGKGEGQAASEKASDEGLSSTSASYFDELPDLSNDPDAQRDFDRGSSRAEGLYIKAQNEKYGPDFTLDNEALREWLVSTPLQHIAAHTACIVRQQELNKVSDYYDAAQDFYADNWHEWDDYKAGTLTARGFIEALIEHVEEVNRHVAEGKKLGLTMEQIILHDSMWGLLPSRFDSELMAVAKTVLAKAEAKIADMRPYIWSQEGKRIFAPRMLDFADKQLQGIGIDIGLHKHYTTEQGYLLDYFARMYWREAASRPEE